MTHGLREAGINVLGGIDNAPDCRETYEHNNAPAIFIEDDISELTADNLIKALDIDRNDNNLLFAGCSPCQYWSKIRTTRRKSEKSAFLLKEFERLVGIFLPGMIVLENVPGLMTNKQSYLSTFLDFLKDNGYETKQDIIDTFEYGVPQHRHRYLLIASRLHKTVTLPEPCNTNMFVRHFIGPKNGFQPIPAGHIDITPFLHTSSDLSEDNLRRIRLTPHDGGDRYSWKDDPSLQINAYRGKDRSFRDVYGRMHWDKPAPTITTRFNSLSNGRFGHPEEDRALSLREGACLQTFPKEYLFFSTSWNGIARQIGNAVPPLLSERIGTHIVRMMHNGDL
jgi:DNA (cytosine-5)-methyltransferase 1